MALGSEHPFRLVRLGEDRAEEAATLLGAAFHDDPLFVHACPDPGERARWLPWSFLWSVWKGLLFGLVLGTEGRLDGLVITVAPDGAADDERLEQAVRLARADRRRGLATPEAEAWDRYSAAVGTAFQPADEELHRGAPGPHWYLDAIAVKPALQGQGIGGRLLRAVNAQADASGLPTVLLTYQLSNLALYRRHGYAVVCEGTESTSRLRWWGMRRDPGA